MHVRHDRILIALAVITGTLLFTGCAGASLTAIPSTAPSTLNPQGPFAASATALAWFLFGVGALVFVGYAGAILVTSWRHRNVPPRAAPGASSPSRVLPIAGIAIPALLLIGTYAYSANTANAIPHNVPGALVVEITGHQWWWQVDYPDGQVTTANEIHIPVGRPVELKGTSADVLHSLWIPQLGGRLDIVPGRQTTAMIQASQPGTYRGECAEFCGVAHAKMDLLVIAQTPDQFDQWLTAQEQVPPPPTSTELQAGQQAFLGSACVYCHTIRGTNATGKIGPDLTHWASRQAIGAGVLPNTRGNLAGWIVNSQGIKPGNKMPPMQLDGGQLQTLLDYLESLK